MMYCRLKTNETAQRTLEASTCYAICSSVKAAGTLLVCINEKRSNDAAMGPGVPGGSIIINARQHVSESSMLQWSRRQSQCTPDQLEQLRGAAPALMRIRARTKIRRLPRTGVVSPLCTALCAASAITSHSTVTLARGQRLVWAAVAWELRT